MCTDLVYQGHIVACIASENVQRIDATRFQIGGVVVDFWDTMHMTIIGNKSIVEIPPEKSDDVTWLTERKNKLQRQAELISDSIAQTQKLIEQIKPKEKK